MGAGFPSMHGMFSLPAKCQSTNAVLCSLLSERLQIYIYIYLLIACGTLPDILPTHTYVPVTCKCAEKLPTFHSFCSTITVD